MKKVNAGIKSKEELRQRLESGEIGLSIFDHNLKFVESNIYEGKHAFLVEEVSGKWSPIFRFWNRFAEVEKQEIWEDKVSPENPALCWVSDENEERKNIVLNVIKIAPRKFQYLTEERGYFKYATPVNPSDCWGYE